MKLDERALSLIEILVVIAIGLMLAAFLLPVVHRARVKAVVVKTKALIAAIEAALSLYESDFGDYPHWQGEGNRILVDLLQGPVENENWHGPYLRVKNEDLDETANIVDAWKTPFVYKYPQTEKPNTPFTIVSAGPDRQLDTGDDIGNW
ncbi:MAG: type II secretion system protein GspG [Candidatus Omnitrophica bacterium]|nr:type II secretion system protein GspG [Candidatus Omnitrophota bacterium]